MAKFLVKRKAQDVNPSHSEAIVLPTSSASPVLGNIGYYHLVNIVVKYQILL